jgi:hypothetical protein
LLKAQQRAEQLAQELAQEIRGSKKVAFGGFSLFDVRLVAQSWLDALLCKLIRMKTCPSFGGQGPDHSARQS